MKDVGTITLILEGVSFEQTEKLRNNIHILVEQGVFSLRNGKAILNFDSQGNLKKIDFDFCKWLHGKPALNVVNIYKNAIIKKEQKIVKPKSKQ